MIIYESDGKFLGEEYSVNGLHTYELRQRNGDKVKHAALKNIGSNDDLYTVGLDGDEFDHDVELKSSFYSKTYAVFASYFTFCKEAVFGRPTPTQAFRDLEEAFKVSEEDEYVPGSRQAFKCEYNGCDFDMRVAEPTVYEKISSYIYSIYERIVWCFYELFGIDD